eukprot:gene22225-28779_t
MSNNDQLEEIEVLSSIYPSEFELLPPIANSSLTNFKIHLVPATTDGKHHVAVSLCCTLPVEYPADSVPILSIEIEKGLSSAQTEELQALAERVATENVGMPRLQTRSFDLRKWTWQSWNGYVSDKLVTVESFNAWKISFDEEMRQLQVAALHRSLGGSAAVARQDLLDEALHNRPTGKQLFLMNKAGSDQDNEVEAMIAAGELEPFHFFSASNYYYNNYCCCLEIEDSQSDFLSAPLMALKRSTRGG